MRKKCAICERKFDPNGTTTNTCSSDCREINRQRNVDARFGFYAHKKQCLACGDTFETRLGKKLTCSALCGKALKRANTLQWNKANRDRHNISRIKYYVSKRPSAHVLGSSKCCVRCSKAFTVRKGMPRLYCSAECKRLVRNDRVKAFYAHNVERMREEARKRRIGNCYGSEYQRVRRLLKPDECREQARRCFEKNKQKYSALKRLRYHSNFAVREDIKHRNRGYNAKCHASRLIIEELMARSVVSLRDTSVITNKRPRGRFKNETRNKAVAALRLIRELEAKGAEALK